MQMEWKITLTAVVILMLVGLAPVEAEGTEYGGERISLFDGTREISENDHIVTSIPWGTEMIKKVVLEIDINSLEGEELDLYIMNNENYSSFKRGEEFNTSLTKTSDDFTDTIKLNERDRYYFILANSSRGDNGGLKKNGNAPESIQIEMKVMAELFIDIDGDGHYLRNDRFPRNAKEWNDTDGDGIGDNSDMFPKDPNIWKDTDEDGVADKYDDHPDNALKSKESELLGLECGMFSIPAIIITGILMILLIYEKRKKMPSEPKIPEKSKEEKKENSEK